MRYRITALAATQACMNIYMRPHQRRGPVPAPTYHFHPVEMAVGQILSMPLFPADIDPQPHPLWLGVQLLPPLDGLPKQEAEPPAEPVVRRMTMRSWMRQVAQQVNPELGDAANALRGANSRGAMVRYA